VMATLNKTAAVVMDRFTVHGCTDVTGFGVLGHTAELANGSGVGVRIGASQVPVLPRVHELADAGFVPGGTKNNYAHLEGSVTFAPSIDQIGQWILCDAVTSGGLLISAAAEDADALLAALRAEGVEAAKIGEVVADHPGQIVVVETI
jgi:selenide, water dikinase